MELDQAAELIRREREAEDLRNLEHTQDIERRWKEEHDRLLASAKDANASNDRDTEHKYVEELRVVDTRVFNEREAAEKMHAEREANIKLHDQQLRTLALGDQLARETHNEKQDALAKNFQNGGVSDAEYHKQEAALRKAWDEKREDIAVRDQVIEANIEENRRQDLSLASQREVERLLKDQRERDDRTK